MNGARDGARPEQEETGSAGGQAESGQAGRRIDPAALARDGYVQTSRRYGHVARIPPGRRAVDVLREVDPDALAAIEEEIEDRARTELLRGPYDVVDRVRLTEAELATFRAAGGGVA